MKDSLERLRGTPSTPQPDLIARVCWYHYRDGQTQQEIADRVGLSRFTINKMLKDASEQGIVRISIDTELAPYMELEKALREKYGLRDVVVVPGPKNEDDVRTIVGFAAGDYVSKHLPRDAILGLGWGGTIHAAARVLQPRTESGNVVVTLSGGLHRSTIINPYDNAAMFARILDAECYYITAPLIVDSKRTRNAILGTEPMRDVFAIARRINMALLTAGDLTPKTWLIKERVLSPETLRSLIASGAVGNVSDHYIDETGRIVRHWVNDLTVTVPMEILREVPNRVLAAGGTFKVPVIRAILKMGLVHVLITDDAAARALLSPDVSPAATKARSKTRRTA